MTVYWDFRNILGVDPKNRTCVGWAKSEGRGCRNIINAQNCKLAEQLLEKMDRQKTVVPDEFEKLAKAMLCLGMHNCKSYPSRNQVATVCKAWQDTFRDHEAKLKRKQSTRKALEKPLPRELLLAAKVPDAVDEASVSTPTKSKAIRVEVVEETPHENSLLHTNDDPFTEVTKFMKIFYTPFEEKLHRTSATTSLSDGKVKSEENSPLLRKDEISRAELTPSKLPSQLDNLPSPSETLSRPISSTQVTTCENCERPSREGLHESAKPSTLIETSPIVLLTDQNNAVKSKFNVDYQEPVPLVAFNFNDISSDAGLQSRRSGHLPYASMPAPVSLTKFTTEFGSRKNSALPFDFQLSASETSTQVGATSNETMKLFDFSGGEKKPPNFGLPAPNTAPAVKAELSLAGCSMDEESHTRFGSYPGLRNPSISNSNASESSSATSEQKLLPEVKPPTADAPSPSPKTVIHKPNWNQDIDSVFAPQGPPSEEPPTNASDEQPEVKTHNPLISNGTPDCLPSIEVSSGEVRQSKIRKTAEMPALSEQKPLPAFNFSFAPKSSGLRSRSRAFSSLGTQSPSRTESAAHGAEFVFGKEYKVPPRSFDFAAWSKLSSAARLPTKVSIGGEGFLDFETKALGSGNAVEHFDHSQARLVQKAVAEESKCDPTSEKASTSLLQESAPQITQPESASKPPKTPGKASPVTYFDSLLTPESTPEPINVSPEPSTPPPKVPKAPDRGIPAPTAEGNTISTPDPSPEQDPIPVATAHGDFGHALITAQERYTTPLSSRHIDSVSILTPPASRETSQVADYEPRVERLEPSEPQGRPSGIIPRKPLPSPQHWRSGSSQEPEVCADDSPELLDWETPSKPRYRGIGRKLRRQAIRATNVVRTGATKVADKMGSLAIR